MKLEQQVPTLELCKKLKELGYPQEGLFWWSNAEIRYRFCDLECNYKKKYKELILIGKYKLPLGEDYYESDFEEGEKIECYVAPTVAEMGEWLIDSGGSKDIETIMYCYGRGWVYCENEAEYQFRYSSSDGTHGTEANARAKMIIWLVENKYLEFKK